MMGRQEKNKEGPKDSGALANNLPVVICFQNLSGNNKYLPFAGLGFCEA